MSSRELELIKKQQSQQDTKISGKNRRRVIPRHRQGVHDHIFDFYRSL